MSAESIKVCMRFRKELGIPVNINLINAIGL